MSQLEQVPPEFLSALIDTPDPADTRRKRKEQNKLLNLRQIASGHSSFFGYHLSYNCAKNITIKIGFKWIVKNLTAF